MGLSWRPLTIVGDPLDQASGLASGDCSIVLFSSFCFRFAYPLNHSAITPRELESAYSRLLWYGKAINGLAGGARIWIAVDLDECDVRGYYIGPVSARSIERDEHGYCSLSTTRACTRTSSKGK